MLCLRGHHLCSGNLMLPLVYTQITFTQVSTPDLKSSSSGLAQANAEPNFAPEKAPEKPVRNDEQCRMIMSDIELRKHFKALNWGVRSSEGATIKFHCGVHTCDETFKARRVPGTDDAWTISKNPPEHACGAAKPSFSCTTALITLKCNLPEAVAMEIERLGSSNSFTSKEIQSHILFATNKLVDTTLIHNIAYRAKQKVFGHNGDIAHLLEQQKVAVFACVHKLCCDSFTRAQERRALGDTYELIIVNGSLKLECNCSVVYTNLSIRGQVRHMGRQVRTLAPAIFRLFAVGWFARL